MARMKWIGCLGVLLCAVASLKAMPVMDSVPLLSRIGSAQQPIRHFAVMPYENPAMRLDRYDATLTRLSLSGYYAMQKEAIQLQLGDGAVFGQVDALAFVRKKQFSLWGGAGYENGRKRDVCFNETSDYERLYPYVMGDSVGGDLASQTYCFHGGFAYTFGRVLLGAEAAFRAAFEYRQVDPRPLNTVSDFTLKIGAAMDLTDDYLMGISLKAGRYKQTNGLKFYNELGVPNVLHFTGLGTDYYRFRGSKYGTYYNGYDVGTDLQLRHKGKYGWKAGLAYDYASVTKIISELNELPLTHLAVHEMAAELAYESEGKRFWGVALQVENSLRLGTENLFGDAANNVYPQIASAQQYMALQPQITCKGLYGKRFSSSQEWHLEPFVGYRAHHESYASPARSVSLAHVFASMRGGWFYTKGKWALQMDGMVRWDAPVKASAQMPALPTVWDTPVYVFLREEGQHFTTLRAKAAVWFQTQMGLALSLTVDYEVRLYMSGNYAHMLDCSLGLWF